MVSYNTFKGTSLSGKPQKALGSPFLLFFPFSRFSVRPVCPQHEKKKKERNLNASSVKAKFCGLYKPYTFCKYECRLLVLHN